MWVILFDLDFTLADTESCQFYLSTQVGREKVVSHIKAGEVEVRAYSRGLVEAFNELKDHDEIRAAVVSDSPRKYCLEVLRQCGYEIDEALVFGAQGKPLVKFSSMRESIAETLEIDADEINFIVVGDSPKDIYFAHSISALSIFAQWGTQYRLHVTRKCRPSYVANNITDVKKIVKHVRRENVQYERYDFKSDYLTYSFDEIEAHELDESDIGFGSEYVPDPDSYRDDKDKYASQNLHWIVKKAKNFPPLHHKDKKPLRIFGSNGSFQTDYLMRQAGFFKLDFLRWCAKKKISGSVAIVPVPSSVPCECNLTSTMSMICEWWAFWINSDKNNDSIELKVYDVFERFWPRQPSHLTEGWRHMEEQFDTLGMYIKESSKIWNVDYVIIIDDVVTSGSHINAVASFIRTAEMVEEDVDVLGYALFKTVHP